MKPSVLFILLSLSIVMSGCGSGSSAPEHSGKPSVGNIRAATFYDSESIELLTGFKSENQVRQISEGSKWLIAILHLETPDTKVGFVPSDYVVKHPGGYAAPLGLFRVGKPVMAFGSFFPEEIGIGPAPKIFGSKVRTNADGDPIRGPLGFSLDSGKADGILLNDALEILLIYEVMPAKSYTFQQGSKETSIEVHKKDPVASTE
jgi:hypothetical protein